MFVVRYKAEIGARVGVQLWKHLVAPAATEVVTGPVATSARIIKTRAGRAPAPGGGRGGRAGVTYSVQVDFAGGSAPFALVSIVEHTPLPLYAAKNVAYVHSHVQPG